MIPLEFIIKTAIIFIFITSFNTVQALNCYICAEAGLEEFGECKTSFPFSCDGYAKRFPNDEKIFCRTTRHKTANGTFTVVKECIADSAHHVTFPRKPYEFAEECDVLDLNGVEVAYCLCGGDNLCNGAPIVGQFSAFERKYPELFDPEPTAVSDQLPLSSQQQHRSAEDGEEIGEEANIRSDQQRERSGEEAAESTEEKMGITSQRPLVDGNVRHFDPSDQYKSGVVGQTPPSQNPFVAPPTRNSEHTETAAEFGTTMPLPTKSIGEEAQRSAIGTADRVPGTESFQCFQCKESNVRNGGDDCPTQMVVNCADLSKTVPAIGRPLCVSRQIVDTKNGRFGVEKECATERAILNELGAKAVPMLNGLISGEISCDQQRESGEKTNGEDGTVYQNICICTTAQCNGQSVGEQMQLANPRQSLGHPSTASSYSSPSVPTPSFDTQQQTKAVPKLSPNAANEPLNCAVCLDVELGNAQSDCRNAHSQNCGHQIRDEKAFCLTRQTQNGKDAFIVEKSCVTKRQFYQQFPEELQKHSFEVAPIGCDATYDGFVNYCLCDAQMCNRNSLNWQAESYGKNNGKMDNKTQTVTSEKQRHSSRTNSAEKRPAFGPSEIMPKISMRPTHTSAEFVQQEENGGQPFADAPSPALNWPTSAPTWPTPFSAPNSVPTTTPPPTVTRNDRLQKWKQNSERAKRPSFTNDGDELSLARRTALSVGIGTGHALVALLSSSLLLLML